MRAKRSNATEKEKGRKYKRVEEVVGNNPIVDDVKLSTTQSEEDEYTGEEEEAMNESSSDDTMSTESTSLDDRQTTQEDTSEADQEMGEPGSPESEVILSKIDLSGNLSEDQLNQLRNNPQVMEMLGFEL